MRALQKLRGELVLGIAALDADAAQFELHARRTIEARAALVAAQVGQDLPAEERIPAPYAECEGAVEHLLDEHREVVERLRLALVRLYGCEGLLPRATPATPAAATLAPSSTEGR